MSLTFFGVITWGASASAWVAKLLNSHPEIFCVHSLGQSQTENLGNKIMHVAGLPGRVAHGNLLAYSKKLITHAGHYQCIGDVHSVTDSRTWQRVAEPLAALVHPRALKTAILVRDPITRIASAMKLAAQPEQQPALIGPLLHANSGYREWLFKKLCRRTAQKIIWESASGYPIFKMEDVVTSYDAAQALAAAVTDGALTLSPEAYAALQGAPVNHHQAQSAPKGSEAMWQSWAPWQRDIFQKEIAGGAAKRYADLGYALPSF